MDNGSFSRYKMKKALFIAISAFAAVTANANCYGTGTFRTCTDVSGNSYNVQRYGNTTNMQGYNAQTGSTWTQNSQTYANTTQIQGNTNGNSWNQTIHALPGMTIQSGTDSRGNSFNRTCTAFGCN
jgi:hypothetical protein